MYLGNYPYQNNLKEKVRRKKYLFAVNQKFAVNYDAFGFEFDAFQLIVF